MTYRTLYKANQRYELAVLWALVAAFLVAVTLMFMHPTGALLIFWMGLIAVTIAAAIERLIRSRLRAQARISLQTQTCPKCGGGIQRVAGDEPCWHCGPCRCDFLDTGEMRATSD